MARHAKQAGSSVRGVVGKAIGLGIAPVLALGAFGPAAAMTTADRASEANTPDTTGSALADAGTTDAQVDTIVLADAPAAETEQVADVTQAAPERAGEASQVEDGVVELDTKDKKGRLAGTVEAPAGFQTVGASWPSEIDSRVPELQVRTRAEGGGWSRWSHLEKQTDGTDEASAVRTSTPVYVGESDAVQIATVDPAQEIPRDVELRLVSSEQVTTAAATTSGPVAAETTSSDTGGPTIITRAEWGAAPQCELPPDYDGATWRPAPDGLKAAAVHHTVNPNDYDTVAEAMQLIRNDQAFHQDGNNWCDIGYNFLVDKWGNVYEGAAGSIDSAIIGAHAGGFNTSTVGIAMLGTYSTVTPSSAQQSGVAKIAAWRLSAFGVVPTGTTTLTSAGSNSKYAAGTEVELNRIFGHRDTHDTECPGNLGYPVLGNIRTRAAAYYDEYTVTAEEQRAANIVQAIFKDNTGAVATAAQIGTWQDRVEANGAGPLATWTETSEKFRKRQITLAYRAVLHRDPTSTERAAQLDAIVDGRLTVDQVRLSLLWSTSYRYSFSGMDAYVKAVYQNLTNTTPTASQVSTIKSWFDADGRRKTVQRLWNSEAAENHRVTEAYELYLGRTPTASAVTRWREKLKSSWLSDKALRYGLMTTASYADRADARY
ncbi:peptidoglycan recognition protein family protein [Myceligenerans crystallogenes]|uniref:N-acetylmuramoyl-L-alanine amidase n=1 Tax=Myceligenerans crystallogenes TaxID=316335 RepID=A0ABN2N595_9MICO